MSIGAIKRELSADSRPIAALAGAFAVAFGIAAWLYLRERTAKRLLMAGMIAREDNWARRERMRHGA